MRFFEPWVRAAARPGVFLVLGVVSAVFLAVYAAVLVPALVLVAGSKPPDALLVQPPTGFFDWLRSGGAELRRLYGLFLVTDSFFPVVYALFLGGWLWRLEPDGRLWRIPLWAAFADYLENLAHAWILASWPSEPYLVAWVPLLVTPLKWALIAMTLLAIVERSLWQATRR